MQCTLSLEFEASGHLKNLAAQLENKEECRAQCGVNIGQIMIDAAEHLRVSKLFILAINLWKHEEKWWFL